AGRERAETEPGENERVVALADPVALSAAFDVAERAARRDEASAVRPLEEIGRTRLRVRARIRRREDHGPFDVRGHLADDLLGERAADTRDADQDRRPVFPDDVEQHAGARIVETEAGGDVRGPCELALVWIHQPAVVDEETVPIQHG